VSDTWPPPGPQKRPPTLEHIRDLWTLHWSQSDCTAAIWRNDFGLELRVLHGDEHQTRHDLRSTRTAALRFNNSFALSPLADVNIANRREEGSVSADVIDHVGLIS
jgi:hypothetical protein